MQKVLDTVPDRCHIGVVAHPISHLQEPQMPAPDFVVSAHGSNLCLFHPLTEVATDWFKAHVEDSIEQPALMFGNAYAVEPRYAEDLYTGAVEAGLNS